MSALGYELSAAAAYWRQRGYAVSVKEIRSRKGLSGNERRVIREQFAREGKSVCLSYAEFQTEIEHSEMNR